MLSRSNSNVRRRGHESRAIPFSSTPQADPPHRQLQPDRDAGARRDEARGGEHRRRGHRRREQEARAGAPLAAHAQVHPQHAR